MTYKTNGEEAGLKMGSFFMWPKLNKLDCYNFKMLYIITMVTTIYIYGVYYKKVIWTQRKTKRGQEKQKKSIKQIKKLKKIVL